MAKAVHLIRHQMYHRSAVQKVGPTVSLQVLGRLFWTHSVTKISDILTISNGTEGELSVISETD